ncbi:MAG: sulfotransferase [Planctomycetaceae bacterium]|nr:sulfotransferase [Planctomycetaceae bacterium]
MAIGKVLLVSGSANFSTRDVWDGYRIGLEVAGIEVQPYPTFSMLKVLSVQTVCAEIIGTALDTDNHIDCVIFVDGLYFRGERARVPLSIRNAGIPTALVATDDPYEFMPATESLYQYRFSNEIRSAGDDGFYLPTATLPPPEFPLLDEPAYDLSFIGTVFEDRLPFLLELAKYCEAENLRMLVAGKFVSGVEEFLKYSTVELRSKTITTPEKWEIYAQSKVTLNLFRETEQPADSPSPRIFEVTAYGHCGLLTGPERSEVRRLFDESVYHFDTIESAKTVLQTALRDTEQRQQKVAEARKITWTSHLYHHRAEQMIEELRELEAQRGDPSEAEHRLAWIIGYGRSGSTWLAEMLGSLPRMSRWHEPYFGRMLRHLIEVPEDRDRPASFYARRYERVLHDSLRNTFFRMARERYPNFGRHALFVKEVNTPELYEWLSSLFPTGKMVFLTRDPYDTLDSFLDLQSPGAWNEEFRGEAEFLSEKNVQRTCRHIKSAALAAAEAFESFPETQKLRITYESLLEDPVAQLIACGQLVSVEVKPGVAREVAEQRDFSQFSQTGPGHFRRQGKAGVWRESLYFNPQVMAIAEEILGPVRVRLGYEK